MISSMKGYVNTGLIFSLANISIFYQTPFWAVMPFITAVNIVILYLGNRQEMHKTFINRCKNLTLALNGMSLLALGGISLANANMLPSALALAFMFFGPSQIIDAISQWLEDLYKYNRNCITRDQINFARCARYVMPLMHGTAYGLIAFAAGTVLMAIPAYIAALAGAVYGWRGQKDIAFLCFAITAMLSTVLLFLGDNFAWSLAIGYPLYAAGNLIRFTEHSQTKIQ